MHILGFLFFIILIILLLGLSVIGNILRIFFGIGKRKNNRNNQQTQNRSYRNQQNDEEVVTGTRKSHKKVFEPNEGEYVDFEEIKDENDN